MRNRVRGWRWRRSPLRRRSDVVEAWTVLVVAVLVLVGAPLAGAAAARWAHDEARSVSAEQRAERHRVRAEVVGTTDSLPSVQAGGQRAYRATVRWTEQGGAPRTTTARVPADTRRGEVVDIWLDDQGRSVPPPVDGSAVWQHTLTIGTCATGGAVLVVLFGHSLVRRVALRRRMAEWDRAWARTEPEWSHRRA
ncbi:hypothetical protein OR263_37280 [Streptomyces sp. NEAU-H22]|uniref:Rv1733c family protein n=1 Tax=unclassified Streptomyces TaxID=2593676 RepID=UPI002257C39F|nr:MULTISPECIES: hypothetical protein [unclassified Streptomyces]MCX3292292.1 hypothetical protein [Streptomyces sp. NEAU-H22]WMD06823.1 hypothetical protein Q7C01_21630 [Streptomyces sp. FXY-T5]